MALDLDIDWEDADAAEILAEVRAADDEEIEAALATHRRERILRSVFGLAADHVDPDKARGLDDALHFKIWDRPDGGYDHLEIVIAAGAGSLSAEPTRDPRLTIKGRAADLIRVATGDRSAMKLALSGRLRAVGDLGFARTLVGLFQIPGA